MKNIYNETYWLMFAGLGPEDDEYATLIPRSDKDTEVLKETEELNISRPIKFITDNQELKKEYGIGEVLGDLHRCMSGFVISTKVKDHLIRLPNRNIQYIPAIIIDINQKWHENYWYMHIYDELECLDAVNATVEEYKELPDDAPLDVIDYSLDGKVLNDIPEKERMLFRLGGNVYETRTLVHNDLVNWIRESHLTGFRFFRVDEFEDGMQFWDNRMLRKRKIVNYLTSQNDKT